MGALIIVLVLIIVASGLFYILADRNLEEATYKAHFDTLRHTMQMLLPWLILVNLIGLIIVVFLAVIFTHRIAGPAYHLIQDMQKIGDGDLTVITSFRKRDRLKMLGQAMTNAIARLRTSIIDIKSRISDLSELAEDQPKIKHKIEEISKSLDKLRT